MARHGLVRVVTYVSPWHAGELARRAAEERRSVSAEVALLVEGALSEPGRKWEGEETHRPIDARQSLPVTLPGSESVLGEGEPQASPVVSQPGRIAVEAVSPSPSTSRNTCPMPSPGRGVKCKHCQKVHS